MTLDPMFVAGWAVILGAMGIWEGIALRRKRKGDTLSELVWAIISKAAVLRFLLLGFLCWLAVHFFFLGRFG